MSNNTIVHQGDIIRKEYQSLIAKEQESRFLKMAQGTALVPAVVNETENSISMTVVKGESLLPLLEAVWRGDRPLSDGEKWLSLLLEWFSEIAALFQSKTGRVPVLEDSHLKNFIRNAETGHVTGLDFEQWHWGEQAECLGIFMAYFESYSEAGNPRAMELAVWLYKEIDRVFQLPAEETHAYMEKQKELLRGRRKTSFLRKNTTAAILVGGKSKRMGRPKDLLPIKQYTFFESILYHLQIFDHIVASVSKGQGKRMSIPTIEDVYPDHGPLGALHAVMLYAKTDWIFLIACDMPAIRESGLYHLFSELTEAYDCFIPVFGGYHHPLAGIYHKRLLPKVERLLLEDRCCMQGLLDSGNACYFHVSEEVGMQLCNINTPKEYEIWKRKEDRDDEGETNQYH